MNGEAFQIRIGCIIPTCFDTTIGYFGNTPFPWQVAEPDDFFLAVRRQMNWLAQIWESLTGYRMNIVSRTCVVDLSVRHLARKNHKRKLKIEKPRPSEFWNRDALPNLRNVMLRCFCIPYPPHIYRKLKNTRKSSVKGHFDSKKGIIWMPCDECREIHRLDFRVGLGHEFKHGLRYLLKKSGLKKSEVPDPDNDRDCRSKLIALLANDKNLALLSKCFPPDPEW